MLEYLGVEFDQKSEDKFKLVSLILKHRELNMIARQALHTTQKLALAV